MWYLQYHYPTMSPMLSMSAAMVGNMIMTLPTWTFSSDRSFFRRYRRRGCLHRWYWRHSCWNGQFQGWPTDRRSKWPWRCHLLRWLLWKRLKMRWIGIWWADRLTLLILNSGWQLWRVRVLDTLCHFLTTTGVWRLWVRLVIRLFLAMDWN